jgi:hypothetical protein
VSIRGRHTKPGRPADFVADVLWVLLPLALAAFLINRTPKDRGTIRYMIPPVLSGAVLTGRVLANRAPGPGTAIAALGLLGLTYAATMLDDLRKPPSADPAEALANWLDSRGLRHGYGPFWDASIVTASSRGRVSVRPVFVQAISPVKHRIEPMRWMVDSRWFSEGPATFVVFEPGVDVPYQFGVDESIWIKSFGPAKRRYAAGRYIILEWGHDLRPLLNHDSP